jgi:hypothetical protein
MFQQVNIWNVSIRILCLMKLRTGPVDNSMELGPSRESASCAATQEFRNIFLNPEVPYRNILLWHPVALVCSPSHLLHVARLLTFNL